MAVCDLWVCQRYFGLWLKLLKFWLGGLAGLVLCACCIAYGFVCRFVGLDVAD